MHNYDNILSLLIVGTLSGSASGSGSGSVTMCKFITK